MVHVDFKNRLDAFEVGRSRCIFFKSTVLYWQYICLWIIHLSIDGRIRCWAYRAHPKIYGGGRGASQSFTTNVCTVFLYGVLAARLLKGDLLGSASIRGIIFLKNHSLFSVCNIHVTILFVGCWWYEFTSRLLQSTLESFHRC